MTTDAKQAATPPTEILTGLPDSRRIALMLQQSATRIVVLTPDPDHARALAHRFRNAARVRIIAAALAGTGGPAEWVRYNEPGLGAFRNPTAPMRKLFPGLDIRKRLTVERMTCAELAQQLGPDAGPLTLEIDAPGEEAQILEALAGSGLLATLREIRLRASRQVLFEGGSALSALFTTLRHGGYQMVGRDDSDADRPMLHFLPDLIQRDLRRKLAISEAGLKDMQEAHKQAETLTEKTGGELSAALRMQSVLQADLDDLRARYEAVETTRAAQAGLLARLLPSLEEAARQLRPAQSPTKSPDTAPDTDSATPETRTAPAKKSRTASKPAKTRSKTHGKAQE